MRRTLTLTAAVLAAMTLSACSSSKTAQAEDESMCREVKPGTVTTVNHYCVVMPEDPVDPQIVREFNGQRVGFCCPGCTRKWDTMTDAQKSKAIRVAVAKSVPQG
jgi:hypothetical protein